MIERKIVNLYIKSKQANRLETIILERKINRSEFFDLLINDILLQLEDGVVMEGVIHRVDPKLLIRGKLK